MTSVTAAGGEEARELVAGDPEAFDLVLLDLVMPGLSGADLVRALQFLRPDLPIVVMSGYSNLALGPTVAELGIAGFLEKPFTAARLGEVLLPVIEAGRPAD